MTNRSHRAARAAVTSNRWMHRLVAGTRAVHSGLWLGCLSDDSLMRATKEFYATEDFYLVDDYNRSGLADWESRAIAAHFPESGDVLVPAAGAGREVIGLSDLGYRAIGYDPSPDLVAKGQRIIADAGAAASLHLSSGDGPPEGIEGPFDAVLFGWGGVSHIRNHSRRISVLSELCDQLSPGGAMIVSFLERKPGSTRFALAYQIATTLRSLLRRTPIEIGDWMDGSYDHYFTFGEISAELDAAGFDVAVRHPEPFPHVVGMKR